MRGKKYQIWVILLQCFSIFSGGSYRAISEQRVSPPSIVIEIRKTWLSMNFSKHQKGLSQSFGNKIGKCGLDTKVMECIILFTWG